MEAEKEAKLKKQAKLKQKILGDESKIKPKFNETPVNTSMLATNPVMDCDTKFGSIMAMNMNPLGKTMGLSGTATSIAGSTATGATPN